MATIIGSLRAEATNGETRVLGLLGKLPDDYIVYPELKLGDDNPDFVVLHPQLGVAVLEVKDWHEVIRADPDNVTILRTNNQTHTATNPDKATRDKAIAIAERLAGDQRLRHNGGTYSGKLRVPWAYGVVFSNISRMFAGILAEVVSPTAAIYHDELSSAEQFERRLAGLDWKFPADLNPTDLGVIRSVLYPELQVAYRDAEGRIIQGVADVTQEQVAREGLYERPAPHEETETTEEGKRAAANVAVRMVGGPAGTGKTLVLILRAKYLARLNPTWRILVLSYNKALADQLRNHFRNYSRNITVGTFHGLCTQILSRAGLWNNGPINDGPDRIKSIVLDLRGYQSGPGYQPRRPSVMPSRDIPRSEYITEEIGWMKDVGIRGREHYLTMSRAGRAQPLRREEREAIYLAYDAYQQNLQTRRQFDWGDVPAMTLAALDDGVDLHFQYDAILVDEAQDFAPVWFNVLRRLLRPQTGMMFLAADGSQRIYRNFSWRALGLDVVGRSRILRSSYRNTIEIARTARVLLENETAPSEARVREGDSAAPTELDERFMRHGPWPTIASFNSDKKDAVNNWLRNKVNELLQDGYRPEEIAIFAPENKIVYELMDALRAGRLPAAQLKSSGTPLGIRVGTMHSAKGLEFRAVVIMRLDQLFKLPQAYRPAEADIRHKKLTDLRLLHVAMTRARERLFLQYCYPLPGLLEPLAAYLKGQDLTS